MRAIARKSIKFSLIFLALMLVILLTAPFFMDVNDYKPQLIKAVEDATGRKLQIGDIQASLFPWVGVSLGDIRLSNREGFSERDFLVAKNLHIKVALLPLLSKQIEIKHFELSGPVLFLEKNADGETNWADLLPAESAPAGSITAKGPTKPSATVKKEVPEASSALLAFQAESIRLKDGVLIWADAQDGNEVSLTELQLEVGDVHLDRPVEVNLSGKLGGDGFALDARLGPVGDLSKLDVLALPVQGHLEAGHISLGQFKAYASAWPAMLGEIDNAYLGIDVQLEQRPDGIRLSEGDIHLQGLQRLSAAWKLDMPKVNRINLSHMRIKLDEQSLLEAQGNIQDLNREPAYHLRINSSRIRRQWLAGILPDIDAMYATHPGAWKDIKFAALVSGDTGHMDIRDLQLILNGELVQMSGSVSFDKPQNLRLRIAARELHLDPWLPQPAQQQGPVNPAVADTPRQGARIGSAGKTHGPKNQASEKKGADRIQPAAGKPSRNNEPDLRFLKPWRVSSQIQVDHAHLRGLDMRHMRLNLNGANGRFVFDPLRFELSGGQVREHATLNVGAYPVRWTESLRITGVRIGPVLKALTDTDILDGTLQMDTKLRAKGLSSATAIKNLNGRGNVMLRNGKIKGFNIAAILRKLTNPAAGSGPKETDFAQMSGSFAVKRGIARNDDLFMASPLLRVTGQGEVDLVKKQLDYHIKPKLVGSMQGQGGDTLTVRKGLSVPLHIRGPLNAPRVRPEIDASTIVENIGGIAGSGTGGIAERIQGVLGGKSSPDTAPPPADQQVPQAPEQRIRKAIEGMIPGL